MIVLNEHEWAEEMIYLKSLGKKPFETLSRVGRYYLDEGHDKKETRELLDRFLIRCDPCASLVKWSDTIDAALTRATKYNAIRVDGITITKPEIEKINTLEGVQLRRLAFTLLCLSKYWMLVNPQNDYWVCCKDGEIMNMANVNTSIKRQSIMYHALHEAGMIQFSKKIDNTKVRVCFAEDGEIAASVTDMRNLGYQYMITQGSRDYYQCQSCGLISKKENTAPKEMGQPAGRPRKYCKECAASIHIKGRVDPIMQR